MIKNVDKKVLKRYRCFVLSLCIISIICTVLYIYCYLKNDIPRNITIMVDKVSKFNSSIPITADFDRESIGVISINNKKINEDNTLYKINDKFSLSSNKVGKYKVDLKAFGVIKLREVNVKVIEDKELIVGGIPIGIYIETDGLLVLGTSSVKSQTGEKLSNAINIVKSGDYIVGINGVHVSSKKELMDKLAKCESPEVVLNLRRDGEVIDVLIKRVRIDNDKTKINKGDNYKLGIWIRNDMQGIGTLTFYDPESRSYGALGHGINDVDTRTLMSVKKGNIFQARIVDIVKGRKEYPGELVGVINQCKENQLGNLVKNTDKGIYGNFNSIEFKRFMSQIEFDSLKDVYKIGLKQDIKKGKAVIRTTVGNKIKNYDIMIEEIDINSVRANKGFVIKIVDDELINKTGGIVQGMSGSPILQNNRVIGAVTHVMVNEPTRGYGIFIENMLEYTL